MRATVWSSVGAAEAASLAADGSAHERAMLQVVNAKQRTVRHLRQLRTHTYVKGATGHLEVTLYRTRPGTTREANLARLDAAESDFSKAEGILGHSTWIAPNGRWVHLVRWRSKADFARTGKALMRTKGVGGWIRSLDYKRFSVLKGDPLR